MTPLRRLHVVACADFSSCQLLADFYLAEPLRDDLIGRAEVEL